jgi:hypothetical protein
MWPQQRQEHGSGGAHRGTSHPSSLTPHVARSRQQARREAQAVLALGDTLTFVPPRQVTALAARYRWSSVYPLREYVDEGGLIAYGTDRAILFRRAVEYVDTHLHAAVGGAGRGDVQTCRGADPIR